MIFAGYVLYKDFEIAATYRNEAFSIKMRGFELVKDPEAYLEPCGTTEMENFQSLTILAKSSILDVRLSSEYASETPIPLIHRTRIQINILRK